MVVGVLNFITIRDGSPFAHRLMRLRVVPKDNFIDKLSRPRRKCLYTMFSGLILLTSFLIAPCVLIS